MKYYTVIVLTKQPGEYEDIGNMSKFIVNQTSLIPLSSTDIYNNDDLKIDKKCNVIETLRHYVKSIFFLSYIVSI